MNKRFNIRAAFEEAKEAAAAAQLEVDKEAAMSPEEKAVRDSALQLAKPTDESEGSKKSDDSAVTDEPIDEQTPVATEEPVSDPDVKKPEANPAPTETPVEEAKTTTTDVTTTDNSITDLDPDSEEGKEKANQDKLSKEMEDDAMAVQTTLESLSSVVKRSLDKGGLNTMSAGALALVLKKQYDRVGMAYNPQNYPSTESYVSVSSRKRNTEIALENIGDAVSIVRSSIEKSISKRTKKETSIAAEKTSA